MEKTFTNLGEGLKMPTLEQKMLSSNDMMKSKTMILTIPDLG